MAERLITLYFGDDFAPYADKPYEVILQMIQDGEVEEAKMPRPTRRNPLKAVTVYRWKGVRSHKHRDLSAQMPPSVTEAVWSGSQYHITIAGSWKGLLMKGSPLVLAPTREEAQSQVWLDFHERAFHSRQMDIDPELAEDNRPSSLCPQ